MDGVIIHLLEINLYISLNGVFFVKYNYSISNSSKIHSKKSTTDIKILFTKFWH